MHTQTHQTIVTGITAVRNEQNQFLFLRRSGHESYGAGKWDFPGGAKEFLETPEQGALRECKEESGLDVEIETLLWYQVTKGEKNPSLEFVSFVYLCSCKDSSIKLSDEHNDHRWLALDEASELDCVPWVDEFVERVKNGKISLGESL